MLISKIQMANRSAQALIPKLIKDNYDNWCIQMRALLGAQDVRDIVKYGYSKSSTSKETKVGLTVVLLTNHHVD